MSPTKPPQNYSDFVCVDDFEQYALKVLPVNTKDYYKSGACAEDTLRNNREAFRRLRIRPRIMRDLSNRTLSTKILGQNVRVPIGVSPTAMQKLAHEDGEAGNAAAVGEVGGIYILATISTTSIEEVAEKAPDTTKWFQLYIYRDREFTKNIVQRLERAGFQALVLTVDTKVFATHYADVRNKFSLPDHLKLVNFSGNVTDSRDLVTHITSQLEDITWAHISWLKSITNMPVVLKGILTGEDAKIGVDMGASAIMVSNHGGRQLDYVPASIEALPEIVKAVGDRVDVYLDGGVRYGTDIFKALALGAKMTMAVPADPLSICFIVMGVSGSGKSTIGESIARELGLRFIDGDHLHPQTNIDKMAAKQPLTDEDRRPWLKKIQEVVHQLNAECQTGVVVCSALKKSYRDVIRRDNQVAFIYLKTDFKVILERLERRAGHFMPPDLLESQFQTLEEPNIEEEKDVEVVRVDGTVEEVVKKCCEVAKKRLGS